MHQSALPGYDRSTTTCTASARTAARQSDHAGNPGSARHLHMFARWIECHLSPQLRVERADFIQVNGVAQRFNLSQTHIRGRIDYAWIEV
jgi:hypothetical protein